MADPIDVRFTPEKNDYIRASRVLASKSTGFLVLAGVMILVMLGSAVILIFPSIGNAVWRNAASITLLVGVFYIIYYLALIPLQLSRAYQKNETMRTERTIIFSDAHVMLTIGDQSRNMRWENIQKAVDGGDFYLLLYKGEEEIYPFVPKASFADQAAQEAFLALLEAKSIQVY